MYFVSLPVTLDDLNGISLVSDPKTNETYLDVSDPLKVFSLMQQWRASAAPTTVKVGPQTYLTEITPQDVVEVARQEYIAPEGTQFEKFVPLDPYPSGELGIRLENLKYLMKKVFEIAIKYTEAAKNSANQPGSQSLTQATSVSKKNFVSKVIPNPSSISRNPHQKTSDNMIGLRALQEQRLTAQQKIFKGPPKTLIQDDPENSRDAEYSLNRSSYLGFTRTQISKKPASLDPVIGGRIPKPTASVDPSRQQRPAPDYGGNKHGGLSSVGVGTLKQLFSEQHTRSLQEKHLEKLKAGEAFVGGVGARAGYVG